jgi:hypothetical protein
VRGPAKQRADSLTRPHDGTTLEQVIGELQSEHGVPQNPQEFRITLKADDREGRGRGGAIEEVRDDAQERDPTVGTGAGGRTREKAPAAPRIAAGAETANKSTTRRRRSRRRRKRGS